MNPLALLFHLQSSQYLYDVLQEARDKAYSALSNSAIPLEIVPDELKVPRSAAQSPLFQAFIEYRQGAQENMPFGESQLEMVDFQAGRTTYDLYSLCDTEILIQSYVNFVGSFAKGPEQQLDQPPLYNATTIDKSLEFGRRIHSLKFLYFMLIKFFLRFHKGVEVARKSSTSY